MKRLVTPLLAMTLTLTALTLTVGLVGCNTNKTAGQNIDDATITASVKGKLIEDVELQAFNINVDVTLGKVTLTGVVPTKAIKKKAGDAADDASGVKKVQNDIQVQAQ